MPKKEYPIQIGAETYLLRYNYNALTMLEDLTGKSFAHAIQNNSLSNMRTLLFVGLMKHHPDMTIESVGDLLDECESLPAVFEQIIKAVGNYFEQVGAAASKKPMASQSTTTGASTGPS